jgi:hypothetical protein
VYFALAGARLVPVRAPGPVHVQLALQQGAETISGEVAVEDGMPTEFYGWLELISHLERAADAGEPTDEAI